MWSSLIKIRFFFFPLLPYYYAQWMYWSKCSSIQRKYDCMAKSNVFVSSYKLGLSKKLISLLFHFCFWHDYVFWAVTCQIFFPSVFSRTDTSSYIVSMSNWHISIPNESICWVFFFPFCFAFNFLPCHNSHISQTHFCWIFGGSRLGVLYICDFDL